MNEKVMDRGSLPAEVFTQAEAALICGIASGDLDQWAAQGQLAIHPADNGNGWVVSAFDLITACHHRGLGLPLRLQNYAKRVLITEDDAAMARAIERVLQRAGYTTMRAPDGFQGGSMVESFSPAVILLDLQMPYMKGIELLRYLRADDRYAQIKIVVISASPPEQLEEARQAGADCIISKPFENSELLASLTALLKNNASRSASD